MSLRSIHAVKVVKRKCPKRGKGRKGRKLDRQSVIEMFNDYLGGVHVVELAHKYLISEESVKERLRDFSVMRVWYWVSMTWIGWKKREMSSLLEELK